MQDLTFTITINRPAADVFEFTTNPANTPKWIDFIAEEQTNEWPARLGTVYRNRSAGGPWSEMEITSYVENREFTMSSRLTTLHVTYIVKAISGNQTELKFREWIEEGELGTLFTQATLEKLKQVMEQ